MLSQVALANEAVHAIVVALLLGQNDAQGASQSILESLQGAGLHGIRRQGLVIARERERLENARRWQNMPGGLQEKAQVTELCIPL